MKAKRIQTFTVCEDCCSKYSGEIIEKELTPFRCELCDSLKTSGVVYVVKATAKMERLFFDSLTSK